MKANASAVASRIGVGVAVAINVVTMENRAVLGQSGVTADKLEVSASVYKEPEVPAAAAAEEAAANGFEQKLQKIITDHVRVLAKETGLDRYLGKNGAAKMGEFVAEVVNAFMEQFLAGTGLNPLLNVDNLAQKITQNAQAVKAMIELLPDQIMNLIGNKLEAALGRAAVDSMINGNPNTFVNSLQQGLYAYFNSPELKAKASETALTALREGLLGTVLSYVQGGLSGKDFDAALITQNLQTALGNALRSMTEDSVNAAFAKVQAVTGHSVEEWEAAAGRGAGTGTGGQGAAGIGQMITADIQTAQCMIAS